DRLRWRYAVQKFDPARTLSPEIWQALEESLVLTASSFGLQPWRFIIVTDPAVKERLAAASFNQRQPADASHLVVFAVRRAMDIAHVDRHVDRMAEVHAVERANLQGFHASTSKFVSKLTPTAQQEWAARQAYIALGAFLTAAAILGVDTCPMEGIVKPQYDEILGLEAQGYTTIVVAAAGYRSADDPHAARPKVRFPHDDVVQRI
ncbi:MAG TPA: NAD(P)H-dependent oxidoreductase, partial [Tepidisphaeraceae bacterium]